MMSSYIHNYTYSEMLHGKRWCTDPRLASPLAILGNGTAVFVGDCVSFHHSVVGVATGVVVKFVYQVFIIIINVSQYYLLYSE